MGGETSPWTWDNSRHMYYIFDHARGVYTYQDGTEVALPETKMATDAIGASLTPVASRPQAERELRSVTSLSIAFGSVKLAGSHSTYDHVISQPEREADYMSPSSMPPVPPNELSEETLQSKGMEPQKLDAKCTWDGDERRYPGKCLNKLFDNMSLI
jgi:hypothetical protein